MSKKKFVFLHFLYAWRILLVCKMVFAHGDHGYDQKFVESFVHYYDVSTVGRYTHEYHPFLFKKSSYGLDELERRITQKGFGIKGRIVLTGYEEGAIPSYYTNYHVCTGAKINDEVRVRDTSGWTQQLHNKFGVMTGFLFRDVAVINRYHENCGKNALFDHVNEEVMAIYDSQSYIFQRHAFGDILPVMAKNQDFLNGAMIGRNQKHIFRQLIKFWEGVYGHELRFGNRQVLGTQDILFSIAHARHLFRSDVPLFKYYVGPDITYPIKVTPLQKEAATKNAQVFVQKFVTHLKPIANEPTVYIFCSFVDGVGKSTLLGNVQNYKKYGTKFVDFDAVDNSSSQFSQLYCYDENVFIADLPAQMSHFTYKPDGMVYFDVLAAQGNSDGVADLYTFVQENKVNLVAAYKKLLCAVHEKIQASADGFFDVSLCDEKQPERIFAKNLFLLKRDKKNKWIPFCYKGKHYIFHESNLSNIRQLVKLELADSVGLKNYEAEQMLFTQGVRFPYPYDFFVDDLLEKFRKENIKNVVFVNFLSMYPRSSRENIRVNYLLQQLSLLYGDFDLEQSLYGPFMGDSQLLYKLKNDKEEKITRAFGQETLTRLGLYTIMEQNDAMRTVEAIPLQVVSQRLNEYLVKVAPEFISTIGQMVAQKLGEETKLLEKVHGSSKNFVNIQELDLEEWVLFSDKLQKIFSKQVKNERLKELWKKPGEVKGNFEEIEGEVNERIVLSDDSPAQLLYVLSPHCKSETLLKSVVRCIRVSWYAALANLVGGTTKSGADNDVVSSKEIKVEKERYYIAPVWVKKTEDGKIAVFRKIFENNERKIKADEKLLDELYVTRRVGIEWGLFKDKTYFLSMDRAQTHLGLFAYGCDVSSFKKQWPGFNVIVSSLVYDEQHKDKKNSDAVIPAAKVWSGLKKSYWWHCSFKDAFEQAKTNGNEKDVSASTEEGNKKKTKDREKEKDPEELLKVCRKDQFYACKLVVRALATLEMIIKDPYGEIAVRCKDKKDFSDNKDFVAALKLFEKVVLPQYFHMTFEKDLFRDYQKIKPLHWK